MLIYAEPIDTHIRPHHEMTIHYPGHLYEDGSGMLCRATVSYKIIVGAPTRDAAIAKARAHLDKLHYKD